MTQSIKQVVLKQAVEHLLTNPRVSISIGYDPINKEYVNGEFNLNQALAYLEESCRKNGLLKEQPCHMHAALSIIMQLRRHMKEANKAFERYVQVQYEQDFVQHRDEEVPLKQ